MRATYEAHVARSCTRRAFKPSVPDAELTEVARDKYLRHDAARLATRMLSEARNALREAQAAGDPEALAVDSFGVSSAYRSALRQYRLWHSRFGGYFADTAQRAGRAAGGAAGLSGRPVAGGLDRDLAGRAGLLQPQRRPGHRPVLPPGQRAGAQRQPRGHPALARHLAAPLADPQRRPPRLPSLREGAVALGAPPGAGHGHADRAGASAAARGGGGRGRRVRDGRRPGGLLDQAPAVRAGRKHRRAAHRRADRLPAIQHAIESATDASHFIYLLAWWVDPWVNLTGPGTACLTCSRGRASAVSRFGC